MPSAGSLTLTDGRLAVLLTEYAELVERTVVSERAHEGNETGTPPRSHSLAHYHNRQGEDLEGRRAEILEELEDDGMPTDHWVGYGNRAVLLTGSPSGYPQQLQLYDCLWASLEAAAEDATPLRIVRASRAVEYRNSLSKPRRVLLGLSESPNLRESASALAIALIIMGVIVVCTLASYVFAASADVLISLILVSGFICVAAVNALGTAAQQQRELMEDELARRERGRVPEPHEAVYVRGRPAEVEHPEPGEQSPVCEGMLDVRFVTDGHADGSRARVPLADVRPAVTGHAAPASADNCAGTVRERILQMERGEASAPWTRR